jgi:hypothetical protein
MTIPLGERTDLEGRLLWQAQWDGYNAGPLCAEAAARITELEAALRNVAAACNQLEGYERLPRERQVELVRAIRRFAGVKPQMLRDTGAQ